MMALAGQIFTLSIESTNQASALIDTSQAIRNLELTLRNDLAGIDPQRSMLIIRTQPVDAYWTRAAQESDTSDNGGDENPITGYIFENDPERYDPTTELPVQPRADMLLFFTSNPARSSLEPKIRSNLAMVVYGHANLGDLSTDPANPWASPPLEFPDRNILGSGVEQFFQIDGEDAPFHRWLPAEEWHLARRAIAIIDAPGNFVLNLLDPLLALTVGDLPSSPHEQNVSDTLITGELDFIRNPDDQNGVPVPSFYQDSVLNMEATNQQISDWLRRSQLDPQPPVSLRTRLGHYFLPNCASFKVEWALSDPSLRGQKEIIWVDPLIPVLTGGANIPIVELLEELDNNSQGQGIDILLGKMRSLFGPPTTERVGRQAVLGQPHVVDNQTHIFFPRDPANPDAIPGDPDPFFPVAIRITIDLFDSAGTMDRPQRHVMILPIGQN